ncbi:MAG: bifunctional diaminohydroxyphosphoribosylaminopyrimidine deaminase/5-amino-6-(5-phosphoribosylamino)uracil reductase RibD [bacterium]
MDDIFFLKRAFLLAKRGLGKTSPNPMVGCVIVKKGRIIGEGYHKKAGFPHAEIIALKKGGKNAREATLYVNLEPCSHYGRTPPCTDAIIKAGIKRVVASTLDPNPIVKGKEILEKGGIKVDIGLLKDEGEHLNEVYFKYIKTGMPFVMLKVGMSLDGKISQGSGVRGQGSRRWITSEASRRMVHRLRSYVDGIMVGKGTIIKDNPYLTTRFVKGKSPIRIIVTTDGKIPAEANVFGKKEDLIIASTKQPPYEITKKAEVLIVKEENGLVSLPHLLLKLGKMGITSILLEGGQRLVTSFLNRCLIDKAIFFISLKLIGDSGLSLLGNISPLELKNIKTKRISDDIMLEGYL